MNALALVVGLATAMSSDRIGSRRTFLAVSSALALVGAVLVTLDAPGAWVWAALLGGAMGVLFTTVMTLPLDAAETRATVVAMTTLMLGVGYSISALAPVVLGAMRDASGSFRLPLALLSADALVLLALTLGMPSLQQVKS